MAKRKAPRRSSRQATRRSSGQAGRKTGGRRKTPGRSRTAAQKRTAERKTASRKAAPKRQEARKTAKKPRKPARASATQTVAHKRAATKPGLTPRTPSAAKPAARSSRKVVTRSAPASPGKKRASIPVMRKPPGLDRERRVISEEDELVPESPPSSLDLDRSASAARTGRRALKERFD